MTVEHFALLPDTKLIEACLGGNSHAWEALLVRYQRLIYSIPLRYGLSEHDANDIFQNVSILILENLPSLRDPERLGPWLVITTRRECWRMFRKRPKISSAPESTSLDEQIPSKAHVENDFLALERQSIVRAAVELLGEPCRQLITLLFYAEPRPAYASIARKFSLPEGSIGPTRARCLEKLMSILEKMGLSET
ncbi:MAG: sigma-70 family RNA polymerase sigma factor [Chloroflexi bacterium HGW-Chloroflexi-6]|nr:MAG: sigma-70 family RNA polymerase sigma factor [Chloroflexi bacterium HGW-Chloroflexi-6]